VMTKIGSAVKRRIDLAASVLALIVLGLPFAAIALAVKLDDCGPVFFRQVRIGRDGKPFRVWKFRTMSVMEVSPKGPDLLSRNDPRITQIGRLLRNFGLDELPQLLNVLTGDMSLVGPRPTLAYQVERYDAFQRRRLKVKPGITSLAVVSGRNAISWEERIRLDVWYVDHWSFWLDLRIMLRTLWCVLITREGLYGKDGVNDTFVGPDDGKQGEVS
jgi:undecaprenyl phosphate N,N'-diacetylbacillosamine 1-phosphate transferase